MLCAKSIIKSGHTSHLLVHNDELLAGRRLHVVSGPLEVHHLSAQRQPFNTSRLRDICCACTCFNRAQHRNAGTGRNVCNLGGSSAAHHERCCRIGKGSPNRPWPRGIRSRCRPAPRGPAQRSSQSTLPTVERQACLLKGKSHLVALRHAALLAGAVLLHAARPCSDHGARDRLLLCGVRQQHPARRHIRHILHLQMKTTFL